MQNQNNIRTSISPTSTEETSVERQWQINCILRVLRDSIDKIRISLILPQIFQNPQSARQRLRGSKYESYIDLIQQFIKEENIDSCAVRSYLNYGLIKIIDIFHENVQILNYFNDWLDDLAPFDKSLIDSFNLLLTVSKHRLQKCAMSELNIEKKVHEIYQDNERLKRNIKALKDLLKSRHINMKWKAAAEEILIKKYEKDLAVCKHENNLKIKQEIVGSSRNIRQIHMSSVIKQKELEEELGRIKASYEQLLMENLKQERSARDEKNKLLLQLQALIKKFDQTMEEKIQHNMELQQEYEVQNELFNIYSIEYNREEAEYERIVRLKEEEEKRENEQKILLFMMNRSARVIQIYWRKFRRAQKKAAKRNKGRGKPKRKNN